MPGSGALIYHEIYDGRGFSRLSDSWRRYRLGHQLLREVGLLGPAGDGAGGYPLAEWRPAEAAETDLLRAHAPGLIARVRAADARGEGSLDAGDTPAWRGVYRRAALAVGGTLLAARLVVDGRYRVAFNPAGGLHHAAFDRAAGFCPFNDLAVAARWLRAERRLGRVAIVDLDGHHGDGTEAIFYDEPVLTASLHRYGDRFYPGTGAAEDRGSGAGSGYNVNVPLERGTGDAAYLRRFDEAVAPALRAYCPELVFAVVGADSHVADPLVRLGLTLGGFRSLAERLAGLAAELCDGRLVLVAGGGYAPEHVARVWAVVMGTLAGGWGGDDPRLGALLSEDERAVAARSGGLPPLV